MASSPLVVRSPPGGVKASTLTTSLVNSVDKSSSRRPSRHSATYFCPISFVVMAWLLGSEMFASHPAAVVLTSACQVSRSASVWLRCPAALRFVHAPRPRPRSRARRRPPRRRSRRPCCPPLLPRRRRRRAQARSLAGDRRRSRRGGGDLGDRARGVPRGQHPRRRERRARRRSGAALD